MFCKISVFRYNYQKIVHFYRKNRKNRVFFIVFLYICNLNKLRCRNKLLRIASVQHEDKL